MIRRMLLQATPPSGSGKPRLRVAAVAAAVWLLAPAAEAQRRQYTQPGQLAVRPLPARDSLADRMADAPWEAGRWRFQPRLSVGDLVYDNNVFDESDASLRQEDLRATALAGIDAYAPVGRDAVFATFVQPSYQWWRDNDQLRRLNVSYGAALFGFFNRISTQLSARRIETERPVNNELRVPATLREDALAFDTSLSIRGPWQVFGSVSASSTEYPNAADLEDRAPSLDFLARDDEEVSLGLAYDLPDRFRLGIGWRRTDSEFIRDPQLRSNQGEYPFLTLTVPGNRVHLEGDFGLRQLEFNSSSSLRETEEAVGLVQFSIEVGTRSRVSLFAARDIVYSAVDAGGFFASDRRGVALSWGDAGSLRATLFAETGDDEFESASTANMSRIDTSDSLGIQFAVPLRWGLQLNLGWTETEIDSTLDDFDRSLTSIRSSVSLDLPDFPF